MASPQIHWSSKILDPSILLILLLLDHSSPPAYYYYYSPPYIFQQQIRKGLPEAADLREGFLTEQGKIHKRFVQWLNHFKSQFAQFSEALPTIRDVEDALRLYKEDITDKVDRLTLNNALDDRSILEFGLDYHLPKFTDAVRNDDCSFHHLLTSEVAWISSIR